MAEYIQFDYHGLVVTSSHSISVWQFCRTEELGRWNTFLTETYYIWMFGFQNEIVHENFNSRTSLNHGHPGAVNKNQSIYPDIN
jgi:hypothetical protein